MQAFPSDTLARGVVKHPARTTRRRNRLRFSKASFQPEVLRRWCRRQTRSYFLPQTAA